MKPNYFIKTEKVGVSFPAIWCIVSLVIGFAFFEVGAAIFVSIMSFALCLLLSKFTQFVLSFQSHSGIVSNSTFESVLRFIWFASVIGFFINIATSALGKPPQEAYIHYVFSIVNFGFTLAASKMWGCAYKNKVGLKQGR